MSDHSLPSDPSSWPRDPFRLLGVSPGVTARELRKAYLHLIRSYKPEHAPEEFKRIRDAYELALPFAQEPDSRLDRPGTEAENDPDPTPRTPIVETPWSVAVPKEDRQPAAPDPWDMACRGEPGPAYRALVEQQGRGQASEESYLQLYWLLAILPELDPSRPPVDWLIRGLGIPGLDAGRLRELLKREIAADRALALDDRLTIFFREQTPTVLAVDVAEARWRAARVASRWSLILADLRMLRDWVPEINEEAWARLLIAAAANLAWAGSPDGEHAVAFAREVERLGHRHHDHADDLYQIEYVQVVQSGLERLGGRSGDFSGIFKLLALSWDERGPEYRARFRAYHTQLAQDPPASLDCLDRIHSEAPAVLGRLSILLGGLEFEEYRFLGSTVYAEIAPSIERFLASNAWNDYQALRPALLEFCVREAVSPGLVARTMAERPEFILTGKSPLAHAIDEDWPLRHLYRACELTWESPARGRYVNG